MGKTEHKNTIWKKIKGRIMLFKKVNMHKKITNIFDAMDKLNKCERKFSIILRFLLNISLSNSLLLDSAQKILCVCVHIT